MAIYNPVRGEYGTSARLRRVTALRHLAATGAIRFDRYVRSEPPTFEIRNVAGEDRTPTGREVPVYLLGAYDLMLALRQTMPDIIDTAFANPSVVDRESLAEAILAELDSRYGTELDQAAEQVQGPRAEEELAAVS